MVVEVDFGVLAREVEATEHLKGLQGEEVNVEIEGVADDDLGSSCRDDLLDLSRVTPETVYQHLLLTV